MAAGAEDAGVGQDGLHRAGIFGVLRLRSVAGLAVDAGVFAGLFHFQNVGVAGFAGLMPGVDDRERRDSVMESAR